MNKGDVEVDAVDDLEPIRLPQVRATAIQTTEDLWHWTRLSRATMPAK
jgi:hypothetical protein